MHRSREIKISLILPLLALLVTAAGYVDLWRGGTGVSSALLVLGYCVLVPLALWHLASRDAPGIRPTQQAVHPPYRAAFGVGVALLALYVATLAPSTAMWDTSEYIAAAKVLGLPHPPGNPTFILLAHVAGMLPLPVRYAARINLLAALASATSAALWFLCAERLLRAVIEPRVQRLVAADAASVLGATAFTVWNQSVVNEKVYTVSLLGIALGSWLFLRWLDSASPARRGTGDAAARDDRYLVMLAYLTGIAYTVHPAGFLLLPPIGLAVIMASPRTLLRWKLVACLAGTLLLGLTPFAFEPVRAAHHPPINEGVPTACAGAKPEVGCTFSTQTARLLSDNIRRVQYGGHPVLERQAPFSAQLEMFWIYFRWQWLRDTAGRLPVVQATLAALFLVLGIVGLETVRRRDRAAWWYFAPLLGTLTIALVFYLNFRYGWSQAQQLGDSVPREPRDRDYFYVWTFSVWGLFAGIGLSTIWRDLADASAHRGRAIGKAWLIAAPVMSLGLVPLVANARDASRAGQEFTAKWAADLLNSVEPYGVLVTNGDNDSFPLWYAQEVEGVRRDVTVALVPYMGLAAYQKELMRRMPAPYDAARGPAIYRDGTWRRPTQPLWRMTAAEADAVPDYVKLREPQRFRSGTIDVTVPPQYLTRDRILVLRAIQDSFPARPIYFVGAGYASTIGLGPYLKQQGLVQRLDSLPVAGRPGIVPMGGLAIDTARTAVNWAQYQAPAQLLREGKWVDAASSQIPLVYMIAAQELAQARALAGDDRGARALVDTIRQLGAAAGIAVE